jgi:hypothetical protein
VQTELADVREDSGKQRRERDTLLLQLQQQTSVTASAQEQASATKVGAAASKGTAAGSCFMSGPVPAKTACMPCTERLLTSLLVMMHLSRAVRSPTLASYLSAMKDSPQHLAGGVRWQMGHLQESVSWHTRGNAHLLVESGRKHVHRGEMLINQHGRSTCGSGEASRDSQ